jgi:hypothetical protein
MRTTLLLLGTIALLIGGFALYWAFQPPGAVQNPAATIPTPKSAPVRQGESAYTVGGGKGAWLKQFDEANRLTHQFRADEYDPQKEGFVRVVRPETHFFLKGGQWIKVTGRTGDVYVSGLPETGSGGDLFAAGGASKPQMPSRGRLNDVRIYLYDTPDAPEPSFDLEVNNAAFDNESFRIFTEAYTDANGKQIPADQVKVTVRGKYEFDGRGLTIRWNDREGRLELLEIAHGERLVVKEPRAIGAKMPGASKSSGVPREAANASLTGDTAAAASGPDNVVPTPSATADAPGDAASPTTTPAADAALAAAEPASTPYSIWFHDNVQVLHGEATIATADLIEVYHAMRNAPAKSPATAPAPPPSPPSQPTELAPPPSAGGPTTIPAATPPAPATQPAAEPQLPITVYWTGKLRIVPSVSGPPVPLAAGETAVQLRGTPVVLTRENSRITCPSLTYRTADGGLTLHSSESFPQVEIAQFATPEYTGKPELKLFSQWVEYALDEGIATLGGKSRAEFPADEAGAAGETATATWTREGIVRLADTGGENPDVEGLELAGDVVVQHPRITLESQKLALGFAPAPRSDPKVDPDAPAATTTRPAAMRRPIVRQVTASEAVHCVLLDESQVPRELFCDHLDLGTATGPAGDLYPSVVKARGNVRATEQGQSLTAQELDLLLAPATGKGKALAAAGAAQAREGGKARASGQAEAREQGGLDAAGLELVRMVARTDVKAEMADGAVATGGELVATNAGGQAQISLSGKPARLDDGKGSVVTSTRIVIPRPNEAQALGPGSLRATVVARAGATPQSIDVDWTDSARVNGNLKENQIDVVGGVKAKLLEEDGTVNTATANRILLTMVPKPADPSAATSKPARPVGPATRPGGAARAKTGDDGAAGPLASMKFDALADKEVSRIILSEDAVVDRRLTADDGSVVREMRIESSLLHFTVKTQRLVIPRPGRMLVRDHRTEEASAAKDKKDEGLGSQRGATAFQWAKGLDYDGVGGRAAMLQDVVVAYKPDDESEPPVQLRADRVVADFVKVTKPAATAADGDGGDGVAGPDMPSVELKAVTAAGGVNVIRNGNELSAPGVTYDPRTDTITASGTDANRAVFSRAGRPDSMSARSFLWNTRTWEIKVIDGAASVSGR